MEPITYRHRSQACETFSLLLPVTTLRTRGLRALGTDSRPSALVPSLADAAARGLSLSAEGPASKASVTTGDVCVAGIGTVAGVESPLTQWS